MRKTRLWIAMECLKWLFFAGVPIALFLWKCTSIGITDGGSKFIFGCSGYIMALIIYVIIKKVMLKNYLVTLNGKIINYTTNLEIETDQTKIPLIERALGKCLMIRDSFTALPIIIVLGLVITLCKAMESDLITLSIVIGLSILSYILGYICMLVQASNIRSRNRLN